MGGPPKVVPPWGMCALEEGERERLNHLFMRREKERKQKRKERKDVAVGLLSMRMWLASLRASFRDFLMTLFPLTHYKNVVHLGPFLQN